MPTLLALAAHPDDESYSFSGTIALAAHAGWRCLVHCATSGERGRRHDGGPGGALALAREREAELRSSCALLGAEPPEFWGLPDGALRLHAGGSARIGRLLDSLSPDVVLSLGLDGAYGHPDHVALVEWTIEAWSTRLAPPPLLLAVFRSGLFLPQYAKCISMMGAPPNPSPGQIGADTWDYEVPLGAFAALKRQSIAVHHTQLPGDDPEALFPPGIVKQLLRVERFADASGRSDPATAALLRSLVAAC